MPIEDELVQTVTESQLLHVDETSWIELTTFLWLGRFSARTVSRPTADRLPFRRTNQQPFRRGAYAGWLMRDGYGVYRKIQNRLRCWAHLRRLAQGLKDSLDQQAQRFGTQTSELLRY